MKNFLKKLKQNKISFSFAVVFTVAITALCVISMLMYYINAKTMINNFFNKSVSTYQEKAVKNLLDSEQLINKTTYQILSTNSIYEIVSGMTFSADTQKEAKTTMNTFISLNNISGCYIVRNQDLQIFKQSLTPYSADDFEREFMSVESIIDNYKKGIHILSASNNPSSLIMTSYDFRGYYIIYIYNKNTYFKDILNLTEENYSNTVYCNDVLLYSSDEIENTTDNKVEKIVRNYKIVSYYLDEAQKSFYEPFFKQFIFFAVILLAISFIILLYSTSSLTSKTEKYVQNLLAHSKQHQYSAIKSTIQKIVNTQNVSQQNHDIVVNYFKNITFKEIYCVHIQLDDIEHLLLTSSYKGISQYMQSIQTVLKNKLSLFGNCVVFDFGFDSTGIILAANDFFNENVVRDKLAEINQYIKELFNLSITATLSEEINLTDDIFYTLLHLNSLKNYRFITGYSSIITETTENEADESLEYPVDTEKEIIQALISGQKTNFNAGLDKFYSYTRHTTFDNAKEWCTQLILSMFKHSNSTNSASILSSALKYDVLEDEIEFLKISFEKTFNDTQDKTHIANNTYAQKLNEIIEKEWQNPDFNLAFLANILEISVVYAGKKFKMLFDKSFNTYLAEYRISKAAIMLADEHKTNADIAQQCGFSSTEYFIKTFKKITSYTPSEYRKHLLTK